MQIPPNLCLFFSIQNYEMPKIEDITSYIFYLCLLEEHLVDPRDIISLCQLFNNDVRKIINQLQFRLLKINRNSKSIQSKKKEKEENKDVVVIDLDDEEDDKESYNNDNDGNKNNDQMDNLENNIENLTLNINDESNDPNTNLNFDNIITNDMVMEHLPLDNIMGIDLHLVNAYNYYLRHHMRPDLILAHTIPNYVLLQKYDQLQYQFEEMNNEDNYLFYITLNKLYEAEVQQLISLNNDYDVDIFDEWGIHDRGGILTWLIKYKKSSRKSNKNDNHSINTSVNDLMSPASSVISSPDFTFKSMINLYYMYINYILLLKVLIK